MTSSLPEELSSQKSGDRHMQSSQAQLTVLHSNADCASMNKAGESQALHVGFTIRSTIARMAAIFDRRARIADAIAADYAGQGWNDSLERELTDKIAGHPLMRS